MSIRIQSKMTITVTPGLQFQDLTNEKSDIPNRLKVSPMWTNDAVQIVEGAADYPDHIAEWPAVKALEKDGILTIGGKVIDVEPKVVEDKDERIKKLKEKASKKLEDIAEE